MKQKGKSSFQRLMGYAGKRKYLTYLSLALAVVSAVIALIPFYEIWRIIKEVLEVRPDFSQAVHIKTYGWYAVGGALLSMLFYIAALMCSHLAAFRVQANMRIAMMEHIMKLPLGYVESEGTGKIRKIVSDSSAATETYLAHNLPDKAVSIATPIALLAVMAVFDWRLGLMCLIPAAIAFVLMGSAMMGPKLAADMKEYQNALESMSSEAVEYVRGIPVVKTFGQTIFSFRRFKKAIDEYEKWTVSYHEIGHALVAAMQTHSAPVQKITIIPRTSGALGYTMQVEEGNHYLMSREEIENKIATFTGGRAAEEVVFGSVTTGASNDIEQATKLARAMLTRYGMSDEFGMVALETVTNQYLGGDASLACSPETQAKIDRLVVELVERQHQKALQILRDDRQKLDELARFLHEKETITGEEFMSILNA